jgi:hypothetical protein
MRQVPPANAARVLSSSPAASSGAGYPPAPHRSATPADVISHNRHTLMSPMFTPQIPQIMLRHREIRRCAAIGLHGVTLQPVEHHKHWHETQLQSFGTAHAKLPTPVHLWGLRLVHRSWCVA